MEGEQISEAKAQGEVQTGNEAERWRSKAHGDDGETVSTKRLVGGESRGHLALPCAPVAVFPLGFATGLHRYNTVLCLADCFLSFTYCQGTVFKSCTVCSCGGCKKGLHFYKSKVAFY